MAYASNAAMIRKPSNIRVFGKDPRISPSTKSLLWQGLLLASLTQLLAVSGTATNWPLCKTQCDKNFTNDSVLEHPGIVSVCHRGCELFTVAMISTPRGGVPLVGSNGLAQQKTNDLTARLTSLLGKPGAIPINQIPDKNPVNEQTKKQSTTSGRTSISNMEKAMQHRKEIEEKLVKKMEDFEPYRIQLNTPEIKKKSHAKIIKIAKVLVDARQNKVDDKFPEMKLREQQKDVASKKTSSEKSTIEKTENKSLPIANSNESHETMSSKVMPNHDTHAPYAVLTGEKAKMILDDVRKSPEKKQKPSLLHGANAKQAIPHGPNPIDSHERLTNSKKVNASHSPLSKTTVQPIPHPVQDHPVHANRQITTDSSDAEERKTTTPQSSNPVAPVSHRVHEFGAFSRLASKLGMSDERKNPFFGTNLLQQPRMGFGFALPQQISIIEIVKKKNNIDFEKLHQEHLKEAAHCPKIHQRFEQAKHSCRHACATAYNLAQEQEACIVGCQIQATTSTAQVKAQSPPAKAPDSRQDTISPDLREVTPTNLARPGDFFSAFRKMFSNLAGKIGLGGENGFLERPVFDEPFEKHDVKSPGTPDHPRMAVEIMVRNTKNGQKDIRETFTNMETHVRISGHMPEKSEAKLFWQKLIHSNDQLLGDSMIRGNKPRNEEEMMEDDMRGLKIPFEIMGQHLNEGSQKNMDLPRLLEMMSFGGGTFKHKKPMLKPFDADSNIDEALFRLPSNNFVLSEFKSASDDGKSKKNDHDGSTANIDKEEFLLNWGKKESHQATTKTTKDCQTVADNNLTVHQLDLLECISRKSGLPRWLIAITVFASALVVFWLCFSLSTPIEDIKMCKPKPTIIRLEDDCIDAECGCKKSLLPVDDVIKIRLQTA